MVFREMAELLVSSNNEFAAGVGQCLHAFMAASSANAQGAPIMVTFGNRTMAFGKKKMASMTGRVSIRTCCLFLRLHRNRAAERIHIHQKQIRAAECHYATVPPCCFSRGSG